MRFPSFLTHLAAAAFLGACAAGAASAQTFSPAAPKRQFDSEGKAFFRGPMRLTVGAGVPYYNGDLTSSPGDQFIGATFNVGFLYRYSPHLGFAGEVGYMYLGAKDHLPGRGLAFNTSAGLVTGLLRWYPIADRTAYAGGGGKISKVLPFVQAGAGLCLYSAQSYIGKTRTPTFGSVLPGEIGSYPDLTAVLPVGAGFTIHCNETVNLSIEGNYYFTKTDTFDDNSKRLYFESDGRAFNYVNPKTNDAFATLMLKAEIKL